MLHASFRSILEYKATLLLFALLTLGPVRGLVVLDRDLGLIPDHDSGNWLVAVSPYFFRILSGELMPIMPSLDTDALCNAELLLGVSIACPMTATYNGTNRHRSDLQQVVLW